MLNTSTLRPGLLVSLKTSIRGNVSYDKRTLEAEHKADDGSTREKWETERKVIDQAEHDAATELRQKAGSLIRRVCSYSAFGLLCPEDQADKLEAAIVDARKLADEFNATAQLSRVSVYVMTGRIASDNVEAVRAINSEIRDLMSDMEEGLKNLDTTKVRQAAMKAKGLGQMLSPEADKRVQAAISAARKSATDIRKKIADAGSAAAVTIDNATIRKIAEQRVSFLDLGEADEVAAPQQAAAGVELSPEDIAYNEENRKRGEKIDQRRLALEIED